MSTNEPSEVTPRAEMLTRAYGKIWDQRFGRIIRFWEGPPKRFPVRRRRNLVTTPESISDIDLMYYIKRYYSDREVKIVMQPVGTLPDPVVDVVLHAFKKVKLEDLERTCQAHRLSMQAENIVGKLLERYVATMLESKGWVWCAGETVRSVDFMTNEETSDVKLLQIKNRSNSENSSSSAVRRGTEIQMWFRIDSMTGQTNWASLPGNEDGTCNEEGFYEFIRLEAEEPRLIEEVPIEEAIAQKLVAEEENNR